LFPITRLSRADSRNRDEGPVCSVAWSADGAYLAVGTDSGAIQIFDVEERKKVRVMTGHSARIASMSWNGHVLSSGCRDGSIWHHDVRVSQHKVMELLGHHAEVSHLHLSQVIGMSVD